MHTHIDTARKWNPFDATMVAEGAFDLAGIDPDEVTDELVVDAYQYLIDTGIVWGLQGCFGRNAAALINQGLCHR